MATLTAEQQARIETNRKEALARLALHQKREQKENLPPPAPAKKIILGGSVPSTSANYQKRQVPTSANYQKRQFPPTKAKPGVPKKSPTSDRSAAFSAMFNPQPKKNPEALNKSWKGLIPDVQRPNAVKNIAPPTKPTHPPQRPARLEEVVWDKLFPYQKRGVE
jgi:hypothetical protein